MLRRLDEQTRSRKIYYRKHVNLFESFKSSFLALCNVHVHKKSSEDGRRQMRRRKKLGTIFTEQKSDYFIISAS